MRLTRSHGPLLVVRLDLQHSSQGQPEAGTLPLPSGRPGTPADLGVGLEPSPHRPALSSPGAGPLFLPPSWLFLVTRPPSGLVLPLPQLPGPGLGGGPLSGSTLVSESFLRPEVSLGSWGRWVRARCRSLPC